MSEIILLSGQYYTAAKETDCEMTVQRSRFIGSLRKVRNRDEVDVALREIAVRYPKASHHCWGYRFTGRPIPEHASDAGEPLGTAGRPILGALKKHSLENTLAVVTRYYGGIKLGVRGLIAAYGDIALLAIENAGIVVEEPNSLFSFFCTYDIYNILLAKLERADVDLSSLKTNFEEGVTGGCAIPNSLLSSLRREIDSINTNRANFSYTISPSTEN